MSPTEPRSGPDPVALQPEPAAAATAARRRVVLDLAPLRHRDFRLLFLGQGTSFLGSMITYVAVPYQVYALTGSSLQVGLLGAVEFVAMITTALLGGALADAVDRRRMVRLTELGLLACSAGLLGNALLASPRLAVVYAVAALATALDSLQRPSLDALLPRLVPREELLPAAALSSLRSNVGMLAGPAVGGVLIASAGLEATYAVDVLTFCASLVALTLMRAVPPPPDAARPSLRGVLEGLRYARSRPELLGTYLVDVNAMFFGMPNALYPAVAASLGGAQVLGLLYTAPAAGALLASLTSGWTVRVHHHGQAVLWAAGLWGLAVVGFGLSGALAPALLFLGLAGAADMVSGLFRSAVWNTTVPDELRGRLAGIELISYSTGPTLGNVEAGAVAALAGPRFSIVSGGVLCVAGTLLLGALLPGFRRYDARDHTAPTAPPA